MLIESPVVHVRVFLEASQKPLEVGRVGPGSQFKDERVSAVTLPPIDSHLQHGVEQPHEPLSGFGVEKVHKSSTTVPPMCQLAVIQKEVFLLAFLVLRALLVNHGRRPLDMG